MSSKTLKSVNVSTLLTPLRRLLNRNISEPLPPIKVSVPAPPFNVLLFVLPVIVLARVFPVPLIAELPVNVKFSTLAAIVKVAED